jgi:hypothetical protein
MSEQLITIKKQLQELVNAKLSLRKINQKTFELRNGDTTFPYFGVSDTKNGNPVRLDWMPNPKQVALKKLQGEKAPGCVSYPKYHFFIDAAGVHLLECTGKINSTNYTYVEL